MDSLTHYLIVSVFLLSCGVYTALTSKNAVRFLMGIELILNAAGLNFVAFARFAEGGLSGQLITIFLIIIAASEAAVALAIILNIYRFRESINIEDAHMLKG